MLGGLLCLLGCGLDPEPRDTAPDTAPQALCQVEGFANQALEWSLPEDPFGSLRLPADPNGVDANWALLGLGGGRLDLVYAFPGSELGWRILKNSGQGFEGEAEWVLPGVLQDQLRQVESQGPEGLAWRLLELTGDGQEDLVITRLPGSDELGLSYWLVYAGLEGGFADTATRFDLPLAMRGASYQLLDQQADGRPDLWIQLEQGFQVHLAEDGGFSTSSIEMRTPSAEGRLVDLNADGLLDWFSDQGLAWGLEAGFGPLQPLEMLPASGALMDLAGHGRLEWVDTESEPDSWTRYSLEPSTLGVPVGTVSLPQGYPGGSFVSSQGTTGRIWYGVRDLDGDGALDLIVTRVEGSPEIGVQLWRVHRGLCQD